MAAITGTAVNSGVIAKTPAGDKINIVKTLYVETANTVDAADTISLTLADFAITTVLGVSGFKHTTDNNIVVTENPTTAVAAGVLTLTVPAGTDDDKRIYSIYYI